MSDTALTHATELPAQLAVRPDRESGLVQLGNIELDPALAADLGARLLKAAGMTTAASARWGALEEWLDAHFAEATMVTGRDTKGKPVKGWLLVQSEHHALFRPAKFIVASLRPRGAGRLTYEGPALRYSPGNLSPNAFDTGRRLRVLGAAVDEAYAEARRKAEALAQAATPRWRPPVHAKPPAPPSGPPPAVEPSDAVARIQAKVERRRAKKP